MSDGIDFSMHQAATASGREVLATDERIVRADWIGKHILPDDLFCFQDGKFSRQMFQEAISCFVNGQFIAVIVLGFSFIERSLVGRFWENGRKDLVSASSENLLKEALARGWLSKVEYQNLDRLRAIRNPIVHFKNPYSEDRPEYRAILSAKDLKRMLESDARQTLEAAVHVLHKTSL